MLCPQDITAANWVEFGRNSEQGSVFYYEKESIKNINGFIYVWSMMDMTKEPVNGSYSVKIYDKIDCEMARRQRLSYVFYEENMGSGGPDYQDSNDKSWKYIVPGSFDETKMKLVCLIKD